MPNANNFFDSNLDILLNNGPVDLISNYSVKNSLKLIVDHFTSYINATEISSETFTKLMTFASSFLTAYCPKLENLSVNDTENINSYFNFLAALQAKTQNLSITHPDLTSNSSFVTPSLNMSSLVELRNRCSQLNLLHPLAIDATTDKIRDAAFGISQKLSTGFGLGVSIGVFESVTLILMHIMERYQFSSTSIKATRIMLGVLNSLGISVLPFLYSFIKNLADPENQSLNKESILLVSICAYISTFSLHILKNLLLRSERGQNYLLHHSALKLFLNALPLLGTLFIVTNTNESILEGMTIALCSFLGAVIPNLVTQFALGFFPNKIEKNISNKEPIDISLLEGVIVGLDLCAPKLPSARATQAQDPSFTQQTTSPNDTKSSGELNSGVISSDELQTMKVKHLSFNNSLTTNPSVVTSEEVHAKDNTQSHDSTQTDVIKFANERSSTFFKLPKQLPMTESLGKIIEGSASMQSMSMPQSINFTNI